MDGVNKPLHYNQHGIECIQAIEASMSPIEFQGYLKGNFIKYVWRYTYKEHPLQDLKKGQYYLNKLIGVYEAQEAKASKKQKSRASVSKGAKRTKLTKRRSN